MIRWNIRDRDNSGRTYRVLGPVNKAERDGLQMLLASASILGLGRKPAAVRPA